MSLATSIYSSGCCEGEETQDGLRVTAELHWACLPVAPCLTLEPRSAENDRVPALGGPPRQQPDHSRVSGGGMGGLPVPPNGEGPLPKGQMKRAHQEASLN